MCTLVTNMARCGFCKDVIESTHRHDFVRCSCGGLGVDGGQAYARRVFAGGNPWADLSIYRPCNDESCYDKDVERSLVAEEA